MHPDGITWCPCGAYLPFDSMPVEGGRLPRRPGRRTGRLLAAAIGGLVIGVAVFQCGSLRTAAPGLVSGALGRIGTSASGRPPVIAAPVCASGQATTASSSGFTPIPGLAVTVDNGDTAGTALLALSGDMGVDPDAEVRVAYSVDGGPARENAFGPSDLADHQQFGEGRLATAVVPLGAGRHRIAPYWRVSGVAGKNAIFGARCLLVLSSVGGVPASSPVVPAAVCNDRPATMTASDQLQPIPGLALPVDGGRVPRRALLELSGNLTVSTDAQVALAYSVDGGPAEEYAFGPANLASHQQFSEVRGATAVMPMTPGRHVVTPYWRLRGDAGGSATFGKRCLTVLSTLGAPAPSGAIVPAAVCAGSAVTMGPVSGAQPVPELAVTIDNGARARRALVLISADVANDIDTEVRVAYSIDGGPPDEETFGSSKLASHQQFSETRASTAVVPLSEGVHRIALWWRVNGPPGRAATLAARCLTVLSST